MKFNILNIFVLIMSLFSPIFEKMCTESFLRWRQIKKPNCKMCLSKDKLIFDKIMNTRYIIIVYGNKYYLRKIYIHTFVRCAQNIFFFSQNIRTIFSDNSSNPRIMTCHPWMQKQRLRDEKKIDDAYLFCAKIFFFFNFSEFS